MNYYEKYRIYLKLIQCYVSITSQPLKKICRIIYDLKNPRNSDFLLPNLKDCQKHYDRKVTSQPWEGASERRRGQKGLAVGMGWCQRRRI